jgi:type I restriction enzyme M protein
MDYWAETMQDDAWMIATDGWQSLIPDGVNKGQPNTDLIPTVLVVARCFATDQAEVERLEAERDSISRQMEELEEEHGGDEGLMVEAKNDKGKITAKGVKDRLKTIKTDPTAVEEKQVLQQYAALADKETAANKQVKEAQRELDAKVAALYTRMTQPEVQVLVVLDKWLATLTQRVQGELDRVSQTLTGRIKQLADRYATPLPQLAQEVDALQAKVNEHLKKMGFAV